MCAGQVWQTRNGLFIPPLNSSPNTVNSHQRNPWKSMEIRNWKSKESDLAPSREEVCNMPRAMNAMSDKELRGLDRGPNRAECKLPPHQKPWTEYCADGRKQAKPKPKGLPIRCPLLCFGTLCCVTRGPCADSCDRNCDMFCRCKWERCKLCVWCGPDCHMQCCNLCCHDTKLGAKVAHQECCECDCISNACGNRYAGCTCCGCKCVCLECPHCCRGCLCCDEERIFMDGHFEPIHSNCVQTNASSMSR